LFYRDNKGVARSPSLHPSNVEGIYTMLARPTANQLGQQFKAGDVVTLKSGGPDMTVQEIVDLGHHNKRGVHYRCQWFADKKLDSAIFPEESLETPKAPTYA
jgi:uncharacterized protein YodC (DUF2158 family)